MLEGHTCFSSTVIATIGRPDLSRAVQSVLKQAQSFPSIEIIIVNDSGVPLTNVKWRDSERVEIVNTQRHERAVAKNVGAAVARGQYLHFLDDDDWVLPGFIETMHQAAQSNPDAGWIYGASQLVDRSGNEIIQLHHNLNGNCCIQTLAGEWIPLQASLIKAQSFAEIGGFSPTIPGTEDIDLARRYSLIGDLDYVDKTIACIGMGVEKSTTDYDLAAHLGQRARESVLADPKAFKRMWESATSSYWVGRIPRVYLTSSIWNLQHHFFMRAVSRLLFGLISIMRARSHIFSFDFWRALSHPHESEVFLQGFDREGRRVERREVGREGIS